MYKDSKWSGVLSVVFEILKAVAISVGFCLIAVLIFAFIIKLASLPSEVIRPVNQVIKAVAVFLGCVFGLKNEGGLWKGAIAGLFSILFAYLIFALIGSGTQLNWTILLEMLFGVLAGAISGVVAVNMHR